jgi:hypothetical protein
MRINSIPQRKGYIVLPSTEHGCLHVIVQYLYAMESTIIIIVVVVIIIIVVVIVVVVIIIIIIIVVIIIVVVIFPSHTLDSMLHHIKHFDVLLEYKH